MAKRFVDSGIFAHRWFRCLNPKLKCTWIYLMTNCDHAGIYEPDLELMGFMIGSKITQKEIFDALGDQISIIDGNKWFLVKFIPFQYGELHDNNNAHKSVMKRLNKYSIDLDADQDLIRGSSASQDKDKDKVKGKVKEKKKNDFSLKSIDDLFIADLQSKNMDVDIKNEFDKFKDYITSKGKTYKNYQSAFRNWIRSPYVEKTDRIRIKMQQKKDEQKRNKELIRIKQMKESGEIGVPDSFKEEIKKLSNKFKSRVGGNS